MQVSQQHFFKTLLPIVLPPDFSVHPQVEPRELMPEEMCGLTLPSISRCLKAPPL